MKKNKILKVASVALLAPSIASAMMGMSDNGGYVSFEGGARFPNKTANIHFENVSSDFSKQKHKFKTSPIFGIAVGGTVDTNMSAELEFLYTPDQKINKTYNFNVDSNNFASTAKSKIRTAAMFLNGRFNITDSMEWCTPYIMGGVGAAFNKMHDINFTTTSNGMTRTDHFKGKKKTNFAYQAGVGIMMPVSEGVKFDIGYRYIDLGKIRSSSLNTTTNRDTGVKTIDSKLSSSVVMAKVTFEF